MKKENGFTLIELLAALVIIGLIISITIPTVLGILKDTEKETKRLDGEAIVDNINNQLYSLQIKKVKTDGTYSISKGKITNSDIFKYKISNDYDGEIVVTKDKKISLTISDGKYCIKKGLDEDKVTIEKYDGTNCEYSVIEFDPCYGFDKITGTIYSYGPQPQFTYAINKDICLSTMGEMFTFSTPEDLVKFCNDETANVIIYDGVIDTMSMKNFLTMFYQLETYEFDQGINSVFITSGILENYNVVKPTNQCSNSNVIIPKSIFNTTVKKINAVAFQRDAGETDIATFKLLEGSITIPNTIESIQTKAFDGNYLDSIIFESGSLIKENGIYPGAFNKNTGSNQGLSSIIYTGTTQQDWNNAINEIVGTPFTTGTVTNTSGDVVISSN